GTANVGFLFGTNVKSSGFGSWENTIAADSYRTKRLRFSAYLKTENVSNFAGLWMRVDGPNRKVLAFDNMQDRGVSGTTDWIRYEIVLDVPTAADSIYLGTLLVGDGKVWTGSLMLDVVGNDVPITDLGDQVSLYPPKNILKQMALFTGEWKGMIHQVLADGSAQDWEFELNGESDMNAFTIVIKGSIEYMENYSCNYIGLLSWDANRKRMAYFETSSEGEVTVLFGKWLDGKMPKLELSSKENDGPEATHQVITFPEDGIMEWELTWKKEASVVRQSLKARRE
ncbi:MAG: hypothetical protein JXA28_01035, partial [Bacteroidetes bacterium]|nr:hypothetical protein [Bacteroidota bacterium]